MPLARPARGNLHTFVRILKHVFALQQPTSTPATHAAAHLPQTLPLLHVLYRALQRALRLRLLQLHLMLLLRVQGHRRAETRHFERHLRYSTWVVLVPPTGASWRASATGGT